MLQPTAGREAGNKQSDLYHCPVVKARVDVTIITIMYSIVE